MAEFETTENALNPTSNPPFFPLPAAIPKVLTHTILNWACTLTL